MPRPAPKRAKILDAAREMFAERGFNNVTLKQVAEKAGVSQGLVIHHFDSLENLYKVVIDEIRPMTAIVLQPQLVENPVPSENLLRKFLSDYVSYRVENATLLKLLDWVRLEGDRSRSETEIEFLTTLSNWIEKGQNMGLFRNDIEASDALLMIAATVTTWVQSERYYGSGTLNDDQAPPDITDQVAQDRIVELLYTTLFKLN